MPKTLREKLKERGWDEKDIERTVSVFEQDQKTEKSEVFSRKMNPLIYWLVLLVAIIGNLIVSVAMIPFLLVIGTVELYFFIALMGFIFGLLFNLLLGTLEHLEAKHHIMAGVFIPALAIINVYMMVTIANSLSGLIQVNIHQNALFVGIVYVLAYSAPYGYTKLKEYRKPNNKII